MTTYVLEMRSTASWDDVRYREYTCSARKAEFFKSVPKIQFTDSGHGIVPHVHEHKGRKLAPNRALWEHVHEHIVTMSRHKPTTCHCGKDGHALNSINCPIHGKMSQKAKIEKLRETLESIAAWRLVNISGEYEHGLRDIIRSITDCASAALDSLTSGMGIEK
jgi:hypothetical protein